VTDWYEDQLYLEDVSVGDAGPGVVVEDLDRSDFVKYAGASGDFNPIHYDEPHAKAAGNPSVFAQGMLIHGFASHMVTDWFGLNAIRRFTVRFQARAWPGDTIYVTGEVTSIDRDEGRVEAKVDAQNQDGEVVVSGIVEAVLPAGDE
jgi:acyl dehydratase